MAIARSPVLVLDCPDAAVLARFYGALLEWAVVVEDGWAEIRGASGGVVAFQSVAGYRPPRWPGQEVPQQAHLDLFVDDLDVAETAAVALGARPATRPSEDTFRVFLDPADHPFCLCVAES